MLRSSILAALAACILAGCGGGSSAPAVQGVVTLDGKPLANATVQLIPQGQNMGQTGFGRTGADGKFNIASADGRQLGAAAGEYKVVISKHVRPDGSDYIAGPDEDPGLAAYKELLPPVYSNTEQTKLKTTIAAEGQKDLKFNLTKTGRGP